MKGGKMGRGTTKTHTFELPFDSKKIQSLRVVYKQNGRIVFKKAGDDIQIKGNVVTVKLSQEDTFAFSSDSVVEIQLRVLLTNGDAKNSDIIKTSVAQCLDDEVIE
jgi:hypothetical protein